MYGKEASNRKQEIDRQHYTIPNQRLKISIVGKSKLLDFHTMPTTAESPTPYIFLSVYIEFVFSKCYNVPIQIINMLN